MAADECEPAVGVYVNRLSDYLFVAARAAAARCGAVETPYKKPREPRQGAPPPPPPDETKR